MRLPASFFLLLIALQLRFVDGALGGIGGKRLLAFGDGLDHLRRRKVFDHLARVHAQGAKGCQAGIESVIVNFFRMQLLIDPLVDAHRRYPFDIAGARPEGQPVERVQSTFLLVHRELRGRSCFLLSAMAN